MSKKETKLLSRTTILIVAGILIAVSARGINPGSIDFMCLVTGLAGIAVFLILDYVDRERHRPQRAYSSSRHLWELARSLQKQIDQLAELEPEKFSDLEALKQSSGLNEAIRNGPPGAR